jgi:hypothetical protein
MKYIKFSLKNTFLRGTDIDSGPDYEAETKYQFEEYITYLSDQFSMD